MVEFDDSYLEKFIDDKLFSEVKQKTIDAHHKLSEIPTNSWIDWPRHFANSEEIGYIKSEAKKIREKCEIFVVIGIGGSYIGSKAGIEFLHSCNYNYVKDDSPKIFFVGNDVNSDKLYEILDICKDKEVCINVISKSGKTLEPAISFRIFKDFLEKKYGVIGARERIYCTTDSEVGLLRKIVDKMGYKSFRIPKNMGGRYSVLSAVGMLPIAVSGSNIDDIIRGALDACGEFDSVDMEKNICYRYACLRNILYKLGKNIEIIVGNNCRLGAFLEWWKQLFGESEGKDGKGIFPSSAIFSTDLHSLGQYIQDGSKILFETIINVNKSSNNMVVSANDSNLDNLNYLSGKSLDYINQKICEATAEAHSSGGVPVSILNIDSFSEYNFGYWV